METTPIDNYSLRCYDQEHVYLKLDRWKVVARYSYEVSMRAVINIVVSNPNDATSVMSSLGLTRAARPPLSTVVWRSLAAATSLMASATKSSSFPLLPPLPATMPGAVFVTFSASLLRVCAFEAWRGWSPTDRLLPRVFTYAQPHPHLRVISGKNIIL